MGREGKDNREWGGRGRIVERGDGKRRRGEGGVWKGSGMVKGKRGGNDTRGDKSVGETERKRGRGRRKWRERGRVGGRGNSESNDYVTHTHTNLQ